ncbi:MAG: DMT family transporter [Bacteroidales bacterium]|nr:DMT family transporter [Bacteroidales bacterium]
MEKTATGLKVYAALITAELLWALSFVWYKQVLVYLPPVTLVFFRLLIAVTILAVVAILMGKLQKMLKKDLPAFIALSFFQPFAYFMGESFGMQYVSSTVGAVVISTIPIFAAIAGFSILKERFGIVNMLGMMLSFAGVGVIVFEGAADLNFKPIGILFLFVAVLAAVGYGLVLLKYIQRYNTFTVIVYQLGLGIFWFLPFFLIMDLPTLSSAIFVKGMFIPLFELAILCSAVAFILYIYSVRNVGISRATVFANLIPVFTAISAYFILNEMITIQKMLGILVVIGGLYLSQRKVQLRNQNQSN